MKELKFMMEKWNNRTCLEDFEAFPETMWELGFEMDCYKSYEKLFGNAYCEKEEDKNKVLKNLKTADRQIVGNFIFSHWRYLTHWCDWGFDVESERRFLKQLFEVLLCKEK